MRLPLWFAAAVSLAAGLTPFATAQTTCEAPCATPSLSGTPAPTPPAAADPRTAELKALDAELDRATLWGDRAAVAAMLDDGMISVGGFDAVTPRQKVLDGIRPRKSPPKSTITPSDVIVSFSGDSAVVTAKKTQTYEVNGQADSNHYRDTNTYVRRGGKWRLVSSVSSSEDRFYSARDVSYDVDFDPSAALGDPKAQVVIYEFSDYECPYCRQFAAETLTRVQKDYIQPGRVALVFWDNPLDVHPRAAAAAAAGRCAENLGKRWPMSDKLLRDPVALSNEDFRRYAREIGLDPAAFDRCMSDPATAERIRRSLDEAYKMGVKGTPMFLVGVRQGDKKVRGLRLIEGAVPYEIFQATLDGVFRARGQ